MSEHVAPKDFFERAIEFEENLVIDAQFLVKERMNELGISNAELAKRTGLSRARVTQFFKPEANPTLRSVARFCAALDAPVTIARPEVVETNGQAVVDVAKGRRSGLRDPMKAFAKILQASANEAKGFDLAFHNDDSPLHGEDELCRVA